jgi:formate dehydrogenase (coenzyme F420) beta subunit
MPKPQTIKSGGAAGPDAATVATVRERVAEMLADVDGVVALRRSGESTAPHYFRRGDDLSGLVLNPRYQLASVASLLSRRGPEARIGVVARACDVRALIEMAKRRQVDPERLHVIGVACTSAEAEECRCGDPAPDPASWPGIEVLGEAVSGVDEDASLAEYRAMPLEERRRFWQQQFSKCIKCYGCRNACPECFCSACALEDKLWVERGVLAPQFPMFHLIRAMHMSGRCVGCRQCELACPMGIPLTRLYDLLREDMADLFGYEPGRDLAQPPPVSLSLSDAPMKKGG